MRLSDLSTAELICARNDLLHIDPFPAAILELEIAKRAGSLERETPELSLLFAFDPETATADVSQPKPKRSRAA